MHKNHFIFLVAFGLLTIACNRDNAKFTVSGHISNAKDSILYLESIRLDGIERIDSVKLKENGDFTFHGTAPSGGPDFYALRIGNKHVNFAIDSTETIQLKADYKSLTTKYDIQGNESVKDIQNISFMQQCLQRKIISLEKNEQLLPGVISDSIAIIIKHYKDELKQKYIYKKPASAQAYFAVCQSITEEYGNFQLFNPISNREDVKCYATVATSWNTFFPESARTKQLIKMAEKGMANTAPKETKEISLEANKVKETGFIDITLPDIESKEESLSDLIGKVILLDFTLYEAPQSAKRTRMLRTIYNKYHTSGFEIYQISLDENLHYWKQACEHLPWTCVHETDGTASQLYAVSNLPTFFLIDKQGTVIKRSDNVNNLESEIESIL